MERRRKNNRTENSKNAKHLLSLRLEYPKTLGIFLASLFFLQWLSANIDHVLRKWFVCTEQRCGGRSC